MANQIIHKKINNLSKLNLKLYSIKGAQWVQQTSNLCRIQCKIMLIVRWLHNLKQVTSLCNNPSKTTNKIIISFNNRIPLLSRKIARWLHHITRTIKLIKLNSKPNFNRNINKIIHSHKYYKIKSLNKSLTQIKWIKTKYLQTWTFNSK